LALGDNLLGIFMENCLPNLVSLLLTLVIMYVGGTGQLSMRRKKKKQRKKISKYPWFDMAG
jgi:hypothetical protein